MDCHRTLFTLSHAWPSSRNYEQVDIIIATIHVLLVPNKRHNCPNRCEFAPDQHNATHARVHAEDIKIEANQYSYLRWNCTFPRTDWSVRADITHN